MEIRHGKAFHTVASNTHQEFLKECILKTTGNILEMGTSQGSTGFILDLTEGTDRVLTTLSVDAKEHNLLKLMYPNDDRHKWLCLYKDWEALLNYAREETYSVIFIDSYPWSSRNIGMKKLYDRCEYMVVHDAKILMDGGFLHPTLYFDELEMCLPLPPYPNGDSCTSTLICSKPKEKI